MAIAQHAIHEETVQELLRPPNASRLASQVIQNGIGWEVLSMLHGLLMVVPWLRHKKRESVRIGLVESKI